MLITELLLLLLLLLLLPAAARAQSGDRDAAVEPRVRCTSDITLEHRSLTCKLVAGRNDDEDDEDVEPEGIARMTACYSDCSLMDRCGEKCVHGVGDTVGSKHLSLQDINLTVFLKSGGKLTATIDPKKIVKPRSPHVWNVTLNQESNKAEIHIQTPYKKEYLKVENQLFQLLIWTKDTRTIQNVTSSDHIVLKIDMKQLQKNTEYQIKVRAIPVKYLRGTWSEWSERFSFFTPAENDKRQEMYILIVCLILLLVVAFSVAFFWKNKIFTYMWPDIPHPKDTLVQISEPNKGLLLDIKPEVFSYLNVYPMEKTEPPPYEETEPSIPAADGGAQSSSTQSSDCTRSTTSASTEELELSALLSRSSSDGEDGLQSSSPSPIDVLDPGERPDTPQPEHSSAGNEAKVFGVGQQEEAYVTMSSFYQIK